MMLGYLPHARRGQKIGTKEWVFGFAMMTPDKKAYIWQDGSLDKDGKRTWRWHEVIPETVGQYTGLKDKNGREIYEGDIVSCKWNGIAPDVFVINDIFDSVKIHPICEVIGDIHNNPELLEKKP